MGENKESKLLSVGSAAPLFEADTIYGKTLDLEALQGRLVWLIFYRYSGCPVCNLHLRTVARRKEWLQEKGVEVVMVFDSPGTAFPPKHGIPFPAIADAERELFQLYGIPGSWKGLFSWGSVVSFFRSIFAGEKQRKITGQLNQMPAHFFISHDGTIEWRRYGKHIGDHPDWSLVEKWVKENAVVTWGTEAIL